MHEGMAQWTVYVQRCLAEDVGRRCRNDVKHAPVTVLSTSSAEWPKRAQEEDGDPSGCYGVWKEALMRTTVVQQGYVQ
jgi:hypothetical protein